jgi:hypothetical protein
MADKNGGFSGGNMLKGLKNRSPSVPDSAMKMPSGKSVDSEATRSETAPSEAPASGGRVA